MPHHISEKYFVKNTNLKQTNADIPVFLNIPNFFLCCQLLITIAGRAKSFYMIELKKRKEEKSEAAAGEKKTQHTFERSGQSKMQPQCIELFAFCTMRFIHQKSEHNKAVASFKYIALSQKPSVAMWGEMGEHFPQTYMYGWADAQKTDLLQQNT